MIKANELRLGNWFYSNIYQQVNLQHLEYLLNENFAPHNAMSPIPLAPEILEKVNDAGFGYIMQNVHEIRKGEFSYDLWAKEMKYLHQLQNLIYILTGEELEIKL